mmetsp:Transcript_15146/g.50283  ORF Transcript_15146/g.50283 Transcript_15146/m.50283 type:complete len:214 (-) Transcript_15146:673-1314(-)
MPQTMPGWFADAPPSSLTWWSPSCGAPGTASGYPWRRAGCASPAHRRRTQAVLQSWPADTQQQRTVTAATSPQSTPSRARPRPLPTGQEGASNPWPAGLASSRAAALDPATQEAAAALQSESSTSKMRPSQAGRGQSESSSGRTCRGGRQRTQCLAASGEARSGPARDCSDQLSTRPPVAGEAGGLRIGPCTRNARCTGARDRGTFGSGLVRH